MDNLPEIVKKLEKEAGKNLLDALKGMIDIYPEVADSYYHELADSINIWILTKGNTEIKKYLLDKLPTINDTDIAMIFKEWINKL